ncbi:hypothetical protein [Malaciobacter canalis]
MFEIISLLCITFTLIFVLYYNEKIKQKDKMPFCIKKKIKL